MSEEQIRQIIRDEIIKTLGFSSSIPLPIDQAFRDRFKNIAEDELSASAVSPSSKEQIHEATSFPQTFSGFKATSDGKLVPYYNP